MQILEWNKEMLGVSMQMWLDSIHKSGDFTLKISLFFLWKDEVLLALLKDKAIEIIE